jgi:hypothetical protein
MYDQTLPHPMVKFEGQVLDWIKFRAMELLAHVFILIFEQLVQETMQKAFDDDCWS